MKPFANRAEAGGRLAEWIATSSHKQALIVAVPNGAIPVALPIACRLECPISVSNVTKIPWDNDKEVGLGAIDYYGVVRKNQHVIAFLGISEDQVNAGIKIARATSKLRQALYVNHFYTSYNLSHHDVIIVDDGMTSGFTIRVCHEVLARQNPRSLTVATPVINRAAREHLAENGIELITDLILPQHDFLVDNCYRDFEPVTDDEALAILRGQPHR